MTRDLGIDWPNLEDGRYISEIEDFLDPALRNFTSDDTVPKSQNRY